MAVTERHETIQTNGIGQSERVVTHYDTPASGLGVVRNVIYILLTTLISLLAIRFFLTLGNADRTNDFADLVYALTAPFVAPFRGLFDIDTTIGSGARLEYEVIIATIVYALIGWVILQLLRAPERSDI